MTGCAKQVPASDTNVSGVMEHVSVQFHLDVYNTKSVSFPGENTVNSIDVLVFRQSDGLMESAIRTESLSFDILLPKGIVLDCYFVVNAGEDVFADVSCLSDFVGLRCSLEDNAGGLLMLGKVSREFNNAEIINVSISRLCSKVELGVVSPGFISGVYGIQEAVIDGVFLINVAGDEKFLNDAMCVPQMWFNRQQAEENVCNDFLYKSLDVDISTGSMVNLKQTFYCCPNGTDNAVDSFSEPDWSPRPTRLVIRLRINGTHWYYPITIPAMRPGYAYIVSDVELLGFGYTFPDVYGIERKELLFVVSVEPWDKEDKDIVL